QYVSMAGLWGAPAAQRIHTQPFHISAQPPEQILAGLDPGAIPSNDFLPGAVLASLPGVAPDSGPPNVDVGHLPFGANVDNPDFVLDWEQLALSHLITPLWFSLASMTRWWPTTVWPGSTSR